MRKDITIEKLMLEKCDEMGVKVLEFCDKTGSKLLEFCDIFLISN